MTMRRSTAHLATAAAAMAMLSPHSLAFMPRALPLENPIAMLHSRPRPASSLSMQGSGNGGERNSLAGKVVYQRFLYGLGPLPDLPSSHRPLLVEERVRFDVGADGKTLEPCGFKTYILRDAPPDDGAEPPEGGESYQRVGRDLYRIHIEEPVGNESAGLGGETRDAALASALYLHSSRPDLFRGEVLELGSGVGIGGILGCITAGIGGGIHLERRRQRKGWRRKRWGSYRMTTRLRFPRHWRS